MEDHLESRTVSETPVKRFNFLTFTWNMRIKAVSSQIMAAIQPLRRIYSLPNSHHHQKRTATMFLRKKTEQVPPLPDDGKRFVMPAEEARHTATWLQWPHNHGWDRHHSQRLDPTWIQMTVALSKDEKVYIIVYDEIEKERVATLLKNEIVNMTQIEFFVWPTNDVWVRDNGPIFVFDHNSKGSLAVTDWKFNGWGKKAKYKECNQIPSRVASQLRLPIYSIPMVNEGGSIEIDGRGTLMAKRSSILNKNRNPGWTQQHVEGWFQKYLGVTNFIWLDGKKGGDLTDDHIDGTARFANGDTIVTFYRKDHQDPREYDALTEAKDVDGNPYKVVCLPITTNKFPKLEDYGIYTNFYVGNGVVLMPTFDDPNDAAAEQVLAELYPKRKIVGINSTELYKDGGILHCVTQQQPAPR